MNLNALFHTFLAHFYCPIKEVFVFHFGNTWLLPSLPSHTSEPPASPSFEENQWYQMKVDDCSHWSALVQCNPPNPLRYFVSKVSASSLVEVRAQYDKWALSSTLRPYQADPWQTMNQTGIVPLPIRSMLQVWWVILDETMMHFHFPVWSALAWVPSEKDKPKTAGVDRSMLHSQWHSEHSWGETQDSSSSPFVFWRFNQLTSLIKYGLICYVPEFIVFNFLFLCLH